MATVTAHAQIAALDGRSVVVVGTYTQVEVKRRHPRDTRPPEYVGHVALVLEDGRKIFVEPVWSDDAIRSEKERAELDGKPVAAHGVLHATMPEPEIPVAMPTAACLSAITAIAAQ